MKFAVQLYSVRDHINDGKDMLEILGKVKEIGFDGVEFAGYFGLSAQELRARCDSLVAGADSRLPISHLRLPSSNKFDSQNRGG